MGKHQFPDILETAVLPPTGQAFLTPAGWMWGWGATVGNGLEGWAPGAKFDDAADSNADYHWENEGSKTSASWVRAVSGGGSSGSPITTSTANTKFKKLYAKTETTGAGSDTRAYYMRLYLSGISTGGGECLRAFTTVEAAVGTARGAHISLEYGTSGSTSGLAAALSATLHIPNTGTMTGNLSAIEAQAWCDAGGDDDVTIPSEHGLIRCTVGGDAGNVASFLNLLHVDVASACVGNKSAKLLVCNADVTGGGGAAAYGLQVRVEGTQYWLPLYSI